MWSAEHLMYNVGSPRRDCMVLRVLIAQVAGWRRMVQCCIKWLAVHVLCAPSDMDSMRHVCSPGWSLRHTPQPPPLRHELLVLALHLTASQQYGAWRSIVDGELKHDMAPGARQVC